MEKEFESLQFLGLFSTVSERNGKYYVITGSGPTREIEVSEEFLDAMIKEGKRIRQTIKETERKRHNRFKEQYENNDLNWSEIYKNDAFEWEEIYNEDIYDEDEIDEDPNLERGWKNRE